jgi:hypothetical protein
VSVLLVMLIENRIESGRGLSAGIWKGAQAVGVILVISMLKERRLRHASVAQRYKIFFTRLYFLQISLVFDMSHRLEERIGF